MNALAEPIPLHAEPKNRPRLRRILWIFATPPLLLVVGLLYFDQKGRSAWRTTQVRLAAKGTPMELNELRPTTVPDEQNFMACPAMRRHLFDRKGKFGSQFKDVFPSGKKLTPAGLASLRASVAAFTKTRQNKETSDAGDILDKLAIFQPELDEMLPRLSLPHSVLSSSSGAISKGGNVFCHLAYCHLKLADTTKAKQMLHIASRMQEAAISRADFGFFLEAERLELTMADCIRAGITEHLWKPEDLAELKGFLPLPTKQTIVNVLHAHRIDIGNNTLGPHELEIIPEKHLDIGMVFEGCWEAGKANSADLYDNLASIFLEKGTDAALAYAEALPSGHLGKSVFPWEKHSVNSVVKDANIIRKWLADNFYYTGTHLMLDLEGYFLKTGSYPKELANLVPEHLPTLPLDTDGLPLRYRLNADGSFQIWSAGLNKVDDWNGTLPKGWTSRTGPALDWILP